MSDSTDSIDSKSRRHFLLQAYVVGGLSTVGVASPFVVSLQPNRKTTAEGGPIEVPIAELAEGTMFVSEWRRKPLWVLRRDGQMIESLSGIDDQLQDPNSDADNQPEYCRNPLRSIKPEYFVAIGLCTHLGCSPKKIEGDTVFLCACHGSRFDFAGRVFKNSPAPQNLIIPPHYFNDDGLLIVGEEKSSGEQVG